MVIELPIRDAMVCELSTSCGFRNAMLYPNVLKSFVLGRVLAPCVAMSGGFRQAVATTFYHLAFKGQVALRTVMSKGCF